jgi:hypothetical protein
VYILCIYTICFNVVFSLPDTIVLGQGSTLSKDEEMVEYSYIAVGDAAIPLPKSGLGYEQVNMHKELGHEIVLPTPAREQVPSVPGSCSFPYSDQPLPGEDGSLSYQYVPSSVSMCIRLLYKSATATRPIIPYCLTYVLVGCKTE